MLKKITALLLVISVISGAIVVSADDETAEPTPEPAHELANTEWQLNTIGGSSPVQGVWVTLVFDDEGKVTGAGGCNGYNASYTVDDAEITFGPAASTRMFCQDVMEQESAFFQGLANANRYELFTKDMLGLYADDELLMDFIRLPSLTNTQWELSVLNGEAVVQDSKITLNFDDEGNLNGTAGCNHYGGSYEANLQAITLDGVFSTEMACMDEDVMTQEFEYLQALSRVNHYDIQSNFIMRLKSDDGDELIFERVHDLLGTNWQLETIGGAPVVGDRIATIYFEQFDHAYGDTGCNVFNAFYEVLDEGKIIFGIVTSTLMACEDDVMAQEFSYQAALYGAYAYELADEQLTIRYLVDDVENELVFSALAVPTTE
jgi:heat shock protein HslJ